MNAPLNATKAVEHSQDADQASIHDAGLVVEHKGNENVAQRVQVNFVYSGASLAVSASEETKASEAPGSDSSPSVESGEALAPSTDSSAQPAECSQEAQDVETISPASHPQPPKKCLKKHAIASAFHNIYWNEDQWIEYLGDCPQWLIPARSIPGKRGRRGDALWDPVGIAIQLHDRRQVAVAVLSKAFREKPTLHPWLPDWKEAKDNFPD